jgi:hypothetical protein
MIIVLFPPTINRNFNGEVTQLPFSFNQVIITDELLNICDNDNIDALNLGILTAIKDNCFNQISLFQINEVKPVKSFEFADTIDGGIINIHFQIPAYCILPDSLTLDETPVSYYCSVRYLVVEQNEEPLGL